MAFSVIPPNPNAISFHYRDNPRLPLPMTLNPRLPALAFPATSLPSAQYHPQPLTPLLRHLGEVGALADAVDAAEGHDVRPAGLLGGHHVSKDVDAALRRQDLHQRVNQGLAHRLRHALERAQNLPGRGRGGSDLPGRVRGGVRVMRCESAEMC